MNRKRTLNLRLDFRSGLPVYRQIVVHVRRLAAAARLRPGDQLPTVRELARMLGVNFNTVARAYRLLNEAGVVSTQRGRGTYIPEEGSARAHARRRGGTLEALAGDFIAEARRRGFSPIEIEAGLRAQLKRLQE